MANESSTNGSPHNDALAALHHEKEESMHKPQAEHHDAEEIAEVAEVDDVPSSASGFVGMLAKGNGASDEPAPLRPSNPPGPSMRPTPQPKSEAEAKSSSPRAAGTEQIRMAREIIMPAAPVEIPAPVQTPAAPVAPARPAARTPSRVRKVPGWYHAAVPVMFTVSSLLTIIGFWALGAVVYVSTARPMVPTDVRYPLIKWDTNVGDIGGISAGSKIMAWMMVIALPVAFSLIVMAIIMQKQIRAAARAAEKAAAAKAEQQK